MKVSVVIPTYNGEQKLPGLIQSLGKQSFTDFEVVVAIDGSTDNTVKYLRSLQIFYPLTILEQPNRGRSVIRNKGAEISKGDLLLFFDDDMLPVERCIERHVEHHLHHPGTILTGGLKECAADKSAEILKYRSFLSEKWINPLKRNPDRQLDKENIFITAANFSIERKLFNKLGGFDETLNDAEDFDLAVRAYKEGVPLFFNYHAFAWHNDRVTCASYIKRQRQYSKANKALLQVKPWIQKEGYIKKDDELKGLRKKIFEFFSTSFWVEAADNGMLKILPRRLRYKLYDLIITANGIYFPEKVKL